MSAGPLSYCPGNSVFHDLHPLTKVFLVGCFIFASYLTTVEVRVGLIAVLLLAAFAAGVGRTIAVASVPILTPLLLGLLLIHGILTEGGGVEVLSVGPVTLWRDGLLSGASFFGILAVFVLAGFLFIAVTHPKKLAVALYEVGIPYKLGYVFVTALQLLPDLQRRARDILNSQRSRGLSTGGSFRHRIRALVALLSPLLISALISTQTRSLALEARGFSIEGPRSSLYSPTATLLDHTVRGIGVTGVLAITWWRFL